MMKTKISGRPLFDLLFFSTVFVACLLLAYQLNFKDGKARAAGVFASDKSIYYVYLPATFIYGWDIQKFPPRCDTIYKGFILDYKTGKIINKMTCGVAILWTPFFLVTHAIATVVNLQPDGFSDFYQKMAIIPPVFFLVLGLFFLKRVLEYYSPPYIAYGCILLIFAGTNLYHYALAEGLMSHVHSFFLFSLYLFLLKKFLETREHAYRYFLGMSIVASLAFLVRPTNLIILLWFFLLDARTITDIFRRIRIAVRPKFLLTFLLVSFLIFLPQLIYWKYVSGSFLHYSYGGEGFIYWKNPVILPLYFSPFNGLFLYNPLVLFFVAGFVLMVFRRKTNGILLFLTFALVTYISGSWHMWFFGGSYGSRPFVEYYALFAIGFGYLLMETVRLKNLFIRALIILCMVAFSYYNLRLIYYNIWYTSSVWAWDDFKSRLDQAGVLHFSRDSYTYINDFENISRDRAVVKTNLRSHSRNWSAILDSRNQYFGVYAHNPNGILNHYPRKVAISCWISPILSDSTGAILVASIEDEKHYPWFYTSVPVNHFHTGKGNWTEVTLSFAVPLWLNTPGSRLNIYLWNVHRKTFYLDDVRIRFE
ncbi:MAG: hypothetical protein WCK09_06520 [Bacteroidota bacterium]